MKSEKQLFMEAEWERHSATQLHWPSNTENWSSESFEQVEELFCKLIEELHFYEVIHLFVAGLEARNRVMNKLSLKAVDLDRIVIHQVAINNVWARDCGPIFVKNGSGESCIINQVNSHTGEKCTLQSGGGSLPEYVANKYGIKCIEPSIPIVGGSIEVNGNGALITTETAFPDLTTDPNTSKEAFVEKVQLYLGVKDIIWLKGGISEDGSNGQVQNVTRWLNKHTVLTMVINDETHPDHQILVENLKILRHTKLSDGQRLNVEVLELPEPVPYKKPFTYAGFYIANGCVFVPQFNIKAKDMEAISLLKKHFPGRKITPIDCTPLTEGSCSGIHGITQPWKGIIY